MGVSSHLYAVCVCLVWQCGSSLLTDPVDVAHKWGGCVPATIDILTFAMPL